MLVMMHMSPIIDNMHLSSFYVSTTIFVNKSVICVDVVYIKYFIYLERIHRGITGGILFGVHVL